MMLEALLLIGSVAVNLAMAILVGVERRESRRRAAEATAAWTNAAGFMRDVMKEQADRSRELLTISRVPSEHVGSIFEDLKPKPARETPEPPPGEDVFARSRRVWSKRHGSRDT